MATSARRRSIRDREHRRTGELDPFCLGPGRGKAAAFYVDALGLPVLFEDEVVVVVGSSLGRVVLHRNDKGHDERGTFPAGVGVGGAAVRFRVDDPDACERDALERGLAVVWPTQEAVWGRFVVLADPDGRSVVLAKMRPVAPV